jgi:hypothetical protein
MAGNSDKGPLLYPKTLAVGRERIRAEGGRRRAEGGRMKDEG